MGEGEGYLPNVKCCVLRNVTILNFKRQPAKKKKKDGRKIYEKQNFCGCGLLS